MKIITLQLIDYIAYPSMFIALLVLLLIASRLFFIFLTEELKYYCKLIEYTYYRKEFKEWVKNKERHTKLK